MLDPNFPNWLLKTGNLRIAEFIHFLAEDYAKRGLTKETDRCVAVSGLEARIARATRRESRYGIFQRYLHRNLLWQTSDHKARRIKYTTPIVPSWSWMACSGGLHFMDKDIPFNSVDWIDDLRFDEEYEYALVADVGKFRDGMKLDRKHTVLDSGNEERGWIKYDTEKDKDEESKDLCKERCVVVGRKSKEVKEYYIIVVKPTSVDGEYRRVGVGLIQSDYMARQRLNARVV